MLEALLHLIEALDLEDYEDPRNVWCRKVVTRSFVDGDEMVIYVRREREREGVGGWSSLAWFKGDQDGMWLEMGEGKGKGLVILASYRFLDICVKCYYGKTLIWGEMEWQDARNRWGYHHRNFWRRYSLHLRLSIWLLSISLLSTFDSGETESLRLLSLHDNKYLRYFKGHHEFMTGMVSLAVSLSQCAPTDCFILGSLDRIVILWIKVLINARFSDFICRVCNLEFFSFSCFNNLDSQCFLIETISGSKETHSISSSIADLLHSPQVISNFYAYLLEFFCFSFNFEFSCCLPCLGFDRGILVTLPHDRSRQQDLMNMLGAMYAAVMFLGGTNTSSVQAVVSVERTVFYREKAAGIYSPLPYAFAQILKVPTKDGNLCNMAIWVQDMKQIYRLHFLDIKLHFVDRLHFPKQALDHGNCYGIFATKLATDKEPWNLLWTNSSGKSYGVLTME
ncbi:hypothetical protein LXL04_023546 [Taraxacum kok-saghyz]